MAVGTRVRLARIDVRLSVLERRDFAVGQLSRRRALAVMEYLKAQGVPEERIIMRFHGERYPLVPNNSVANRDKNRRVSVRLDKVPEAPVQPTEQATPAAPPVPATPAATS